MSQTTNIKELSEVLAAALVSQPGIATELSTLLGSHGGGHGPSPKVKTTMDQRREKARILFSKKAKHN